MSKLIFREIQSVFDSQIREFDYEQKLTSQISRNLLTVDTNSQKPFSMHRDEAEKSKEYTAGTIS